MHVELAIDGVLLTAFALLAVGVLVAANADRVPVPSSVLFLGVGMAIGDDGLALIRFDDPLLAQNLAVVALVVILFEGGLTTSIANLRSGGGPGFLLSNVGVFVTTVIVACAVRALLATSWETALLLGAIVSSTDAAAVFTLLKRAPLPRRLGAVLEVESGANDPFAVVLTLGLVAHMQHGSDVDDWVVFGAAQLLGGLAVGVAVGAAGVALLRRVRFASPALAAVLAFAVGGLAYAVAAHVGGSGFLAVYVAGVAVGAGVPRHRRTIRDFNSALANAAEIGLFLLLGLLVFPSRLPGVALQAIAVAAVLVLVARPIAVLVCLTPFRIPVRQQAVVAWSGLRGAVPIVLATFPFTAGVDGAATLFDVVFFVVLVSVVAQGSTVPWLVRRLGLATTTPPWAAIAEALPVDSADVELVEVTLTEDLAVVGRRLRDAPLPSGFVVTTIVRGDGVVLPTGTTELAAGDVVVVAAPRGREVLRSVTAWARGGVHGPDAVDSA